MFRGKAIHPLGFSRRGDFIGERQRQRMGQPASPCGGAARGWAAPPYGEPGPWPLAPLRLIFGLHEASVKIGGSAFVSSNSKNISCVTFLKHKNSRKQGTGTVASC
jgi:hypothetical protein